LLLDVLPLSLGIETLGGINTVVIPKNTTIPTAKSQIFSTAVDSQPSVEINILQGERPMANDNRSLGKFILDGIPPAPRGMPQIEVNFDIDANGILTITAKDKASGKTQSIKVQGSIGLSKEEVERMKKDAEMYAEQDQKTKDSIEAKNLAENMIYTGEKTLKDLGEKVPAELKQEAEQKIEELKKVKDSDNIDEVKSKTEDLSQSLQKIGAQMYQQQGPQPEPQTEQPEQKKEDGPQAEEGEYKEKNG
jgi:molecular chaperone DnaK